MAATLKDVASKTGLSIATISKYVNGQTIKQENKEKIDAAIKELNFKINYIAKGLKSNKSMTIGVLIPELENVFATHIMSRVEDTLMNSGYSTIICDYKNDADLERQKLSFLLNRQVDGIIAVPTHLSKDDLAGLEIPIVLIDRIIDGVNCDCVLVDNKDASFSAVEYLINKGHRDIAIISGPKDVYTARERTLGYIDALVQYSIPLNESYIFHGNYDTQSGYNLTMDIINMQKRPSAIYVTNNEMTIGSVIALNECGVDIPNDISFIGFDNIDFAKVTKPNLSIIVQPRDEIGVTAANLLIEKIHDPDTEKRVIKLKTSLIKQASVSIRK